MPTCNFHEGRWEEKWQEPVKYRRGPRAEGHERLQCTAVRFVGVSYDTSGNRMETTLRSKSSKVEEQTWWSWYGMDVHDVLTKLKAEQAT